MFLSFIFPWLLLAFISLTTAQVSFQTQGIEDQVTCSPLRATWSFSGPSTTTMNIDLTGGSNHDPIQLQIASNIPANDQQFVYPNLAVPEGSYTLTFTIPSPSNVISNSFRVRNGTDLSCLTSGLNGSVGAASATNSGKPGSLSSSESLASTTDFRITGSSMTKGGAPTLMPGQDGGSGGNGQDGRNGQDGENGQNGGSGRNGQDGGSGINKGAIGGGVVGGIIFLSIAVACVWILCRRRRRRHSKNPVLPTVDPVPRPYSFPETSATDGKAGLRHQAVNEKLRLRDNVSALSLPNEVLPRMQADRGDSPLLVPSGSDATQASNLHSLSFLLNQAPPDQDRLIQRVAELVEELQRARQEESPPEYVSEAGNSNESTHGRSSGRAT